MPEFGTCLDKHQVVLLGLVFTLLRGNLPLLIQISLVADQHNNNVIPSLSSYVVDPLFGVLE